MTSIISAAPVQTAQSNLSPQSQQPTGANSDAPSFQSYMKASSSQQKHDEQGNDAVPQKAPAHSGKEKSSKEQKDEKRLSDTKVKATVITMLTSSVEPPAAVDSRSFRLSFPQTPAPQPAGPQQTATQLTATQLAGADHKGGADSQSAALQSNPEAQPRMPLVAKDMQSLALPKGQIAFSVNLPKANEAKQPPMTGAAGTPSASKTAAPEAVKPLGESKNSSSKQQHSNSSGNGEQGSAAPEKDVKQVDASAKVQATIPMVNFANASAAASQATHVESHYSAVPPIAQPANISAPAPVASISEAPEAPAVRSQNIDLKIAGQDNREVDVRISQRAGDVQVTVRTPDGDLAQSLRQHLPELSDRLAQTGVHNDLWQPTAAQSANTGSNNSDSRYSDDAQNQQHRQQQDSRRGSHQDRQQQEETAQAAWLNELNNADKKRS